MRDLTIHGNDLIVATHGRSFWVLDDITPLRQLNRELTTAQAHLYAPEEAVRMHRDRNPDTPLPPEVPAGKNPPDGAIIDYFLANDSSTAVTLEILDADGKLVRRYASTDKAQPLSEIAPKHPIPMYWVREDKILSAAAGMHRFVWDVRYAPPKSLTHGYPISAILHDTPLEPLGAWALPGRYTVKLTVKGQSYQQPLVVEIDPRVKSSAADLEKQSAIEQAAAAGMNRSFRAIEELQSARAQAADQMSKASPALKVRLADFDKKAAALEGATVPGFFGTPLSSKQPENFATLNQRLGRILAIADSADSAPTATVENVAAELQAALQASEASWMALKKTELAALNQDLEREKLSRIDTGRKEREEPASDDEGDDEP